MNSTTHFRISALWGTLFLIVGLPLPTLGQTISCSPVVPLTVELASGRHFHAELDRRTDQGQLWLRWSGKSGYLLRPIDWDRVVRVEYDGETYTGHELREAVAVVREAAPDTGQLPTEIVASYVAPPEPLVPPCPGPLLPPPGACPFVPGPVRSLAIEARVVNWDSDAAVDGLLLEIYPLDGEGFVVPVRGTIEVELIGEESGRWPSRQPTAVLDRWTEQVCPVDFQAPVACYKLPFRQIDPEFDLKWSPKGLLHVRLSVPGEGVFEASQSGVRILP